MDVTPFLPMITGALGGAVSAGVFEGPIQTLQDLWYINFGYKASDKRALLMAKRQIDLDNLQKSTVTEVSKINPDNVQEPKLSIIGPALEASRFYIEEENLREMFAKVIAGSMDSSKNALIHPSFVEIIKQLSSTDARLLSYLKRIDARPSYAQPIMRVIRKNQQFGGEVIAHPIIFIDDQYFGFPDYAPSVNNLDRLGILSTDFLRSITTDEVYNQTEATFLSQHTLFEDDEIKKGILSVTTFGKNFIDVCV